MPSDEVPKFFTRVAHVLSGSNLLADLACGRVYAALPGLADDEWAAVCAAAAGTGGHVILERAPGEFKQRHDVFGPARGEWRIMHRIKRGLDPHNVFAPGQGPGAQ